MPLKFSYFLLVLAMCNLVFPLYAQEQAFGLQEKPGAFLPDNLIVFNEDSIMLELSAIVTKPTLLNFVYYHCPSLCPKMIEGIAELVNFADARPGTDYQIITISIDHTEGAGEGNQSKQHAYEMLDKDPGPYFWRFFTADSANISRLTRAVGWEFRREGDHFVHTTSSVLLTPKGMVSQYFYGTYFNYMHFNMSIEKAKEELIVPTRLKTLKYCYNYKPEENNRVQLITRVYGVLIILIVLSLFIVLAVRKSKSGSELSVGKND